jgi:hypothetical protein
VALAALRDDEAYYERFAELFGLELRSATAGSTQSPTKPA